MYPVRNSVKAIIVEGNKLLCIKKTDDEGPYYLLPGGGQEKNETFIETVKRECREELGAEIAVGKLMFIREYIGRNHEFKRTDDNHQVEFMFECSLVSELDSGKASHLDDGQCGVEWVCLEAGGRDRVYPRVLVERIMAKSLELYWGDIN